MAETENTRRSSSMQPSPDEDLAELQDIRRRVSALRKEYHALKQKKETSSTGRRGIDIVVLDETVLAMEMTRIDGELTELENRIAKLEERRGIKPRLN